jgi:hypothetical protein
MELLSVILIFTFPLYDLQSSMMAKTTKKTHDRYSMVIWFLWFLGLSLSHTYTHTLSLSLTHTSTRTVSNSDILTFEYLYFINDFLINKNRKK